MIEWLAKNREIITILLAIFSTITSLVVGFISGRKSRKHDLRIKDLEHRNRNQETKIEKVIPEFQEIIKILLEWTGIAAKISVDADAEYKSTGRLVIGKLAATDTYLEDMLSILQKSSFIPVRVNKPLGKALKMNSPQELVYRIGTDIAIKYPDDCLIQTRSDHKEVRIIAKGKAAYDFYTDGLTKYMRDMGGLTNWAQLELNQLFFPDEETADELKAIRERFQPTDLASKNMSGNIFIRK